MKVYQSNTILSLSVNMINGKARRVNFDNAGGGKGTYTCKSEIESAAIESHPLFGVSFFLSRDDHEWDAKPVKQSQVAAEADAEVKAEAVKDYKEVAVNSWEEAKNYLIENYGAKPGQVNLQSKISKFAEANNVKFIF